MELEEEFERESDSSLNIDSPNFNSEFFLQETFKECSLKNVMDLENEIARDTATLHSDMQTLVYENYNKFISATETVQKMASGFKEMETEMELLSLNMNAITGFFDRISDTLEDSRSQISRLTSTHTLLNSLQFLFQLPSNLKQLISDEEYAKATEIYLNAAPSLRDYGHMPSFHDIQAESEQMLEQLKAVLHEKLCSSQNSTDQLKEAADLLLRLKEPGKDLCVEYLAHCDSKLSQQLNVLKTCPYQDLIEFMDLANTGFLSDLALFVQSFSEVFFRHDLGDDLEEVAEVEVSKFVMRNMEGYFGVAESVLERDQHSSDTIILVRALDRFYRRLQSIHQLLKGLDFLTAGAEVVIRSGRRQCRFHLQSLKTHFSEQLTRLRQTLAAGKSTTQDADQPNSLPELLQGIIVSTTEKLKGVLQDLLIFLQPDVTFGVNSRFQEVFCVDSIREGLVIGFLHHITATARGFCEHSSPPPTLLLLLSKFCLEFQQGIVQHLIIQADEWFGISDKPGSEILTSEAEVCSGMRESAQSLLNSFVRAQGQNISQMLRKSVETRDWLNTIEPRTVRAVMKRVVEDVSAVETQVGVLYEEGIKSERSSDSSRKTMGYSMSQLSKHQAYRSNWSTYASGQTSLVPNINKLFSERIEFFSTVEFSKVSILTGIIKISLKTLLECIRLRTFSRYGLQQIQVDVHFLQLYLWRFVADENLVHFLLDEILGSAVQRCLDPVLMEPSVVEVICERG